MQAGKYIKKTNKVQYQNMSLERSVIVLRFCMFMGMHPLKTLMIDGGNYGMFHLILVYIEYYFQKPL